MVSDWSGSRYSLVAKSKICRHSKWSVCVKRDLVCVKRDVFAFYLQTQQVVRLPRSALPTGSLL